jgi:hypothetical protein
MLFVGNKSIWSSKFDDLKSEERDFIMRDRWYVSNIDIIFDAPCLFIHHFLCVLLHFVVFLCIFRN